MQPYVQEVWLKLQFIHSLRYWHVVYEDSNVHIVIALCVCVYVVFCLYCICASEERKAERLLSSWGREVGEMFTVWTPRLLTLWQSIIILDMSEEFRVLLTFPNNHLFHNDKIPQSEEKLHSITY